MPGGDTLNIKIQIINRVTTECIELLKKGKIDIAFGTPALETM